MQGIISGQYALNKPDIKPVFDRVADKMYMIYTKYGYLPRTNDSDPITSRPREHLVPLRLPHGRHRATSESPMLTAKR